MVSERTMQLDSAVIAVAGIGVAAVARNAGVEDMDRWDQDRQSSSLDSQLSRVDTEAQQLGFTGTPSFLVEGPKGRKPLPNPGSAAAIESAIKSVS